MSNLYLTGKLRPLVAVSLCSAIAMFASRPVAAADDTLDFLLQDQESPAAERVSEQPPPDDSATEKEPQQPDSAPEAQPEVLATIPVVTGEQSTRPGGDSAEARVPRGRVIEEILVTAQKREQSIQDVPISVSVMDNAFMRQQGVTDFRDISLYVPNATIDNNGEFNDVRIRGFGSPLSNKAFEQSVGLVINGVPYGRREFFVGPLYDVDRVEVLRGPQGTLFGKNTTAGLFNVVTKRPSREFEADTDIEYGELDRLRLSGGMGGPLLGDSLNFRISALKEQRDGIMENTTARTNPGAKPRAGGRDRQAVRLQLEMPEVAGADALLILDHVNVNLVGGSWEFRIVDPDHAQFYRQYDPNVDFKPDNWIGSVDANVRPSQKIDSAVLNVQRKLGEWDANVLGAYAQLASALKGNDVDFTPAPMITNADRDKTRQQTLEFRLNSPSLDGLLGMSEIFGHALGTTDLTVGAFYQQRRIYDSVESIRLNDPVLAEFVLFQAAPTGQVPLDGPLGSLFSLSDLNQPVVASGLGFEETTGYFSQTGDSKAVFGQMDWHWIDRWTLQVGARYTQESKSAHNSRETTEGSGVAFSALGLKPFDASLSRSETAFTPKVAINWNATDDVSFYASWAKGFKSGGFNALASNADDPSNLEFEPEEMYAWELGGKIHFLDGAANANFAVYRQTVKDLQVFTVQPSTAVVSVTNAGEGLSEGLEGDLLWLATDWLTMRGSLAYNDAKYLEFPLGDCTGDRPDTDGDGDPRCDLTGRPFYRTPKWNGTLGASGRWSVSSLPGASSFSGTRFGGLELTAGLTVEYFDDQYVDRTDDPRTLQRAFYRLGGSLGIADSSQGWSFRIVGENLTNKATVVQAREVTLSSGEVPGSPSDFVQIPEAPRLLYGSFRWVF